jgi:hypothetical protein
MDRPRHPDETTTRMAAFVTPEDEEVPWIRVLVRNAPWMETTSSTGSAQEHDDAPVDQQLTRRPRGSMSFSRT